MTQDKLSEELSAYELQVLIGTSISGCNMPPSATFDLEAAWSRLFTLGLIDRVDGLAIATKAGTERIRELLALRSATPMPGVKALEWVKPLGSDRLMKAETILGVYQTWTHHEASGKWFWQLRCAWTIVEGGGNSETEVKRAAEADYEARILSTLTTPPAREISEAEVERATTIFFDTSGLGPHLDSAKNAMRAALEAARSPS